MSGYVKNTWVNQDVERPKTYEVTTNADGSITLTDSFGLVTELGTPVNADNMNHIEDGLTRVSITEYDNTFTYSEDDWVTGVVDGEKQICKSLQNNNTGKALTNSDYWEVLDLGGGGSGYQMFDIVMKDHVLSYEETLGFAPLGTYVYKEAIAGTRYGYPDFYQKCVDEYNNGTSSYMSSNITVVGSLTDNEGVISGFSTSNYATIGNFIGTTTDTIEFVIKLNTGSSPSSNSFLYSGFSIQFYNGKLNLAGTGNIGTYTYSANTDYYIKVTYSNNTIECAYSTDGISYTADGTISYTGAIQNLIYLGWGNANNALSGSIDLNECHININGIRWWNGINEYIQNSNGHKFYDITDKATFDNMFAITGEAWYYGIDTTNERVFLPRSTRFKNGTTSDVGEYQEAGLPSIEHTHSLAMASSDSGETLIDRGSGSTIRWSTGGINSTISSIYGNSTTVEYSSTKLIPYMVVGNQSSWSGMTDVVNQGMTILSQVNAGLATKLDLDLTNITNSTKSTIAGYAMPSDTYKALTLGASGTTYTAPANGWFCLYTLKTTAGYNYLQNSTSGFRTESRTTVNNTGCGCYLPVKNGDIVIVNYDGVNRSDYMWRFYYSVGSESEAN